MRNNRLLPKLTRSWLTPSSSGGPSVVVFARRTLFVLLSALAGVASAGKNNNNNVANTAAPPEVETIYSDFAAMELANLKCGPLQDFENLMDAHLIHYTSDDNYDKFVGHDLVDPDHVKERPRDVASDDGKPKTVLCFGNETDDGTWFVQRIGPFRSTGGNDWWQFAWLDMYGFGGSLGKEHRILGNNFEDSSLGMTGHWSGPITPDGKPIGLPPLHIHHIHLTQGAGFSWSSDILDCVTGGSNCPDGGMMYAHHGDKQAKDPDDPQFNGLHTFGEDYGGEWAKKIYEPISCTGEINDLRPPGSPEIEWWYQSAVRVVRNKKASRRKPLSMHYLYNPFELGVDTQFSRFGTYKVHPSHDTVHVYTGRMPYGGELIHGDGHSHMTAAQQMILFEGSPEDLGLASVALDHTWVPLRAVDAMRAMGLGDCAVAEPAGGENNQKILDVIDRSVKEGRAYRVCQSVANRVEVDGRNWDRAGSIDCNPWSFESGTQYTSVAFNGNPTLPDLKDAPGIYYHAVSKLTRPKSIPEEFTFPQHSHWFLSYASRDEHSKYTWAVGSQDPDACTPVVSKVDLLRLLVWGTPRRSPTLFDTFVLIPVLNLALVLLKAFDPTFTWFSPWPLWTAIWLLVALFLTMVAAFAAFLWSVRNPTISESVRRLSLRLRGGRLSFIPPEILPDKARYPIGLEILTYFSFSATFIAAFATAVTLVVPSEVYLVSEFGQELIREAGEDLNWSTGKPGVRDHPLAFSVLVVLALILGLGTVAHYSLGATKRTELTRKRLSQHIKTTKAMQAIRRSSFFKILDLEEGAEDEEIDDDEMELRPMKGLASST